MGTVSIRCVKLQFLGTRTSSILHDIKGLKTINFGNSITIIFLERLENHLNNNC